MGRLNSSPQRGSTEEFITEHYWGFTKNGFGNKKPELYPELEFNELSHF